MEDEAPIIMAEEEIGMPHEESSTRRVSEDSGICDEPSLLLISDTTNDAGEPGTDLGSQFENLLESIGGFGRYQKCVIFLVILPMFFMNSFMNSAMLFITAEPSEHWCHIPLDRLVYNFTDDVERNLLPPDDSVLSRLRKHKVSECQMYDINYTEAYFEHGGLEGLVEFLNHSGPYLKRASCKHGWHYKKHSSEQSIIMEFDLVCALAFLPTLAYILTNTSAVLGIPLGGFLSDRFGRRPVYFWFLVIFIGFGIGACFSPTFVAFIVLTTLQNIASNPGYILPYMIGLEILGPSMRSTYSVLLTVAFTLGGVAFTGVAYYVRNWRYMLLYSTAPFVAYFAYWFVTPESPRWLLSVKRYDQLECFLRKVARRNGKDFDLDCEQRLNVLIEAASAEDISKPKMKESWVSLFRYPNLRKKTLLLMYLSCAVNVIYNGMNFYAPSFGSDPYLNFLLVGLAELPSSILTQLVADRLGRRLTMVSCFVLGSAAAFSIVFLPHSLDGSIVNLVLFLTVKLFITSAYTVQELIVYELLPTTLRGEGVAITNFVGYLISNFGPVIVFLRSSHAHFPMLTFGSLMVGGIACAIFIPETYHRPLPETVEEAENVGKHQTWRELALWPPRTRTVEVREGR